jgi:hypothetical protein
MIGNAAIREINRVATREARRNQQQPWQPNEAERLSLLALGRKPLGMSIPFLADYKPGGWRQTDDEPLFVDMCGCGLPREPALTMEQFCRTIAADPEGTAYAVLEHGQFQARVARFVRKVAKPHYRRGGSHFGKFA